MSYTGCLDMNDGWTVEGWAFDARRPCEPVEVEFMLSSGVLGTVVADVFRRDLEQSKFGNGRHAFRFVLPALSLGGDNEQITARVKGSDFVLDGSPMLRNPRRSISLVAADIVNNCNLRCPFCLVDYANVRGLKLMSWETYRRALELLPQMPRGGFWLSCLHEPTLHPQFVEMLEAVPDCFRDRISFTTNLSKRLSDDTLERIANSGVNHIRVSFDSREPNIFAELRKGAKFEIFEQNLSRLTAFMRVSPRRPWLHLITMALKENYLDIPALVRHGRDNFGANSHEVRFPYYLPHIARWGSEHMLAPNEWAELEQALVPLATFTELIVAGPPPGVYEDFEHQPGLDDYTSPESPFGGSDDATKIAVPDPVQIGRQLPDEALRLRMRWDGVTTLEQQPDHVFRINLNLLDNAVKYFDALRIESKGQRKT